MAADGGIRHSFIFAGGGNIATIGGIVRTITQIANHLAEQGHEVRYLAKLHPNSDPFYPLHEDVILEPIDYPHSVSQIPKFANRLNELETDVLVIAHSGRLALNMMKAAQNLSFPVVRSEHGNPVSLLQQVWQNDEQARRVTFQLADYSHVLYPEFSHEPDLGEAVKSTLQAIPSPIELDAKLANPFQAGADGKFKIVSSGRIEEFEKNSGLLLDAFLQLAEDFPDWECHFLGDGNLRPELEAICEKHGRGDQVIFHGSVEESVLFENLSQAHLFVMPSDTEGCPMALGEALAHGLPAIGFADSEGVNKMIRHGVNGILAETVKTETANTNKFAIQKPETEYATIGLEERQSAFECLPTEIPPSRSRENTLAESMRLLMSSPRLRQEYGARAPQTLTEYDRVKVLDQWANFLIGIARKNSSVFEQRALRREQYPELMDAPIIANQAINRFSNVKKTKSIADLLKLSMLYLRNKR